MDGGGQQQHLTRVFHFMGCGVYAINTPHSPGNRVGYTMQRGPESDGVEFSQIRDNAVEDLFTYA